MERRPRSSSIMPPRGAPASASAQPVHVCERCGAQMDERQCKIICGNCGAFRDCSDP